MIEINTYTEADRDEIISLVLHCQNDGTRPFVSAEAQPELFHITEKYMGSGGGFWVARENGHIAGCIGLMKFDGGIAVLKKFFVYEPYRSAPHHLGRRLYAALLDFAKGSGIRQILLDTPKNTVRAHEFYRKAGFLQIEKERLPFQYDHPYADSDFFSLKL